MGLTVLQSGNECKDEDEVRHGSKFRVQRFEVAGFRPENANLPTLNLER
jgi:hypothetical protein